MKSTAFRLARGALYEVVENGPGNRLTVRGEQGEVVTFSPMAYRRLSVYEAERSELAVGDRVHVTRNDAALDLANGDRFTVSAVTSRGVTLADDPIPAPSPPSLRSLPFPRAWLRIRPSCLESGRANAPAAGAGFAPRRAPESGTARTPGSASPRPRRPPA
jgi:hypothetical protein